MGIGKVVTKGDVVITIAEKREAIARSGTQNKTALAKIEDAIAKLTEEEQVEIEEISSKKVDKEQEKNNILKDFDLAKKDLLANESDAIESAKSEVKLLLFEAERQHKAEVNDCENMVLAEEARNKAALKSVQDKKEMSDIKLNTLKTQADLQEKNIDQTVAKIKRRTERAIQELDRKREQDLLDLNNSDKALQTRIKKCKNEYAAKKRQLESSKIPYLSEDATTKDLLSIYDKMEKTLVQISQPAKD